jgi:general secretion pathway protein G
MKPPSTQSGFTLIEIMVVVFIIGLLAALVVPKVVSNTDKARVAKAKADVRAIEEAAGLYKLDNGRYPTSLEQLVGPGKSQPEGYLPKLPVDPWDNPYVMLSDGRHIEIKSLGADGAEGGEGWDADISSADL